MIHAKAHPNLALIKYWGKRDEAQRIPSTPSLSIPLLNLETRTAVQPASSSKDEVFIGGNPDASMRVAQWLDTLRNRHGLDIPPLKVESVNNFPTSAGLASSASGFAALSIAINKLLGLGLEFEALSRLARLGSASAARSVRIGYVALNGQGLQHESWCAGLVAEWNSWPLGVSAAICALDSKPISSTDAMRLSRDTSSKYGDWIRLNRALYDVATKAVLAKDFEALAQAARWSFYGMLSVMASSRPSVFYLNQASLSVIEALDELQRNGCQVFFTCDAGPQVKCVYHPQHAELVRTRLESISGVLDVRRLCP